YNLVADDGGLVWGGRITPESVAELTGICKHIRVLRVTNQDVMENIDGVVLLILQRLESAPPPLPSPVRNST
ncbi:MAG: hypothetical protein JW929_08840, partial [Anaerolineales bacterium]|nr:hypothetical protein [Anaerolineales bacterium]